MNADLQTRPEAEAQAPVALDAECVVVGAGPAGVVLSLLLARKGISVVLIEAHEDFDRDFRGDTIHPSVLELMDELGLAERLHQLRHAKIHTGTVMTPSGPLVLVDFRRLKTRYPYIMMLPQRDFLGLVAGEAARHPSFRLLMGARVDELIEEGGAVRGVRFEKDGRPHEVRAALTVGADGRSSRVRHLAGFQPVKTSPPMDVLWFRLPHAAGDPEGAFARFGGGRAFVFLDRGDQWQIAGLILKGSYRQVREAGVAEFRRTLAETAPDFAERAALITDWKQVAMLSVESSRVPRWHAPGLLLIGDAAHVMSPAGGVGINYAIQDAVVAANVLAGPLKQGGVTAAHLREVQRQREWPTKVIQFIQTQLQKRIIAAALDPSAPFRVPLLLRLLLKLPYLRDLPSRVIGFGVRRVRAEP